MFAGQRQPSEEDMADVAGANRQRQSASERAQRPASEQMRDAASQGMDQAAGLASSVAGQAAEAVRAARDAAQAYGGRAGEMAGGLYEQGQQLARRVGGQVQDQWTILLAGVAVGYLIGYAIHGRR
jgi:hypothetical protein